MTLIVGSKRPGSYSLLLASLLLFIVANAFVDAEHGSPVLSNLILSITLVLSIYPVRHQRGFMVVGGLVAATTFIAVWLAQFTGSNAARLTASAAGCVFFIHAAGVILVAILQKTRITADELAGAVSAYLLIGISGGLIFSFIDLAEPGSIIATSSVVPTTIGDASTLPFATYLYFSFTCMTTLGFGDLIPATPAGPGTVLPRGRHWSGLSHHPCRATGRAAYQPPEPQLMSIRTRVLLLLAAIALIPVLVTAINDTLLLRSLGSELTTRNAAAMADQALVTLQRTAAEYANVLDRETRRLRTLLRMQAATAERLLHEAPPLETASPPPVFADSNDAAATAAAGSQVFHRSAGADPAALQADARRLTGMQEFYALAPLPRTAC